MPPVRRVVVAALVACCLTFVAALLIAGHGPWAGRRLLYVTEEHGLNAGDVPVLVAWVVGMAGCAYLGSRR